MFAADFSTSRLLAPFGAVEILLPGAIALALWTASVSKSTRLLWVWILPLCVIAFMTAVSKIAFIGWGVGIASIDFTGFSGHALFSASIYPVIARLMTSDKRPGEHHDSPWPTTAVVVAYLFAAIIAFSRIRLAAHSWSEVISGSALGVLVSGSALWRLRDAPLRRPPLRFAWIALAAWFVVLPLKAAPSRTQDIVTRVALVMADRDEPYDRDDLRRERQRQRGITPTY
jgi:membrane-associated phospholipid phosphatase